MQEELQRKSVSIMVKSTKVTAKTLAKAMTLVLRQIKKAQDGPGKTSIKKLAKSGALQNVEIFDNNIKSFDPIARKYGIRYALVKDDSETPPKWMVFFHSRDAESLMSAFKEFSAKTLNKTVSKPSVHKTMQKFMQQIKNAVVDRTKNKQRSEPER